MNSGPIDISSDEETGLNDPEDDNADWLSNLIDSADNQGDDDSDDVVVISEVNSNSGPKSSKWTVKDVDDDCVVLDGDPDKAVSVVDDSGSGSDELIVVGEKGQIACRDYPHPRHLCAKFPFSSTPPERHCDVCHCYVCDSLAPCVHWGTGASTIGHCHATETVEMWKIMRRNFKMGRSASMPAIKVSLALPQPSQVPPLDIIRLTPKSILQTQVPRPTMIRACPSASLAQVRSHLSGMRLSKDGIRPSSVPPSSASQQLLSDVVRSSRAHNIHRASSPTMFKRVGSVRGPLQRSRSAYGSSNNSNYVNPSQYVSVNHSGCANPSQYGRIPAPMAASNDGIPFSWQDNHSSLHQIPSLPMGSSIVGSAVPSQPQVYSQPIPQSAWLLDNQPVTNDSVPSQLDLLSPGPPLADAGMLLFDFETSFNSLTQV
ncbi:hypothetical protein M0R45_010494 [Rubus argutus]|uniref:Uncharacterized protein n=1 Tax=Rubus argutus TaxID=59490 RepID=A0AAW1Y9T0_RUBAR